MSKPSINIELKEKYIALKEAQPKLRIRNAAKLLGVSEMELLELELGTNVIRLETDWTELLREVHTFGHVMALTRNEYAVHERKGVYDNISFDKSGKMGVAVNPDIDLRFLMWNWKYGYAVRMEKGKRVLHSLQFFNNRGEAVHKIYLTQRSSPLAYEALIKKYKSDDQVIPAKVEKGAVPTKEARPDSAIDVAAFKEEWLGLKDTHDFFPMLKKYDLRRTQAFRLAPKGYAQKVSNDVVTRVLGEAVVGEVPIMVFVNSSGCIQIHTGTIHKLVPMDNWINIMDPEFNLHLNTEGIAETWVVRKPTADGVVTSLEVFDDKGELIVYFFGERKPGKPELESWRKIMDGFNMIIAIN